MSIKNSNDTIRNRTRETYICIHVKFSKNAQTSNFRPVGAELFDADGRTDGRRDRETDVTYLIIVLSIFSNAAKNVIQECETHPRSFDIQASFLTFPP